MEVECPNGARVAVDALGVVFGRRHLGAAAEDGISREQFKLDLVEGVPDVAQLQVLGRNGETQARDQHKLTADQSCAFSYDQ